MKRRGLTLVELLVVIAVIGILVGLLLPAVLSARSSGRRSQCANNLRQLGVAVQQFHERHGMLPAYWGSMTGRPRDHFGGWLLHLLPDLGEQAFFDTFSIPGHPGVTVEFLHTTSGSMIAPQIPASADYQPGTWVTSTTSVINAVGISIPIVKSELVGQVGTPPQGPWYESSTVIVGTGTMTAGIPDTFALEQSRKSLDVVQCSDDASTPLHWMQRGRDNQRWSLTNYMANAHVFLKFGTGRRFSVPSRTYANDDMGGRWGRPTAAWITSWGPATFTHREAFQQGLRPRQFAHIVDGLSNTIMFGEAMRRCDADARSSHGAAGKYRFAFLPTATQPAGEEHTFGIDPAVNGTTAGLSYVEWGGWGNTLMFQQRPPPQSCNHFRLQANHDVLNVVMCDGSVRGISPRVSRREQCDPDVAGRDFGSDTYNPTGLGGVTGSNVGDGVWDMLMVPNDPPSNVLTNTGEIGKEK